MSDLTPRDTTGYAVKVLEKLFLRPCDAFYANVTEVKVYRDPYTFVISRGYDSDTDTRYLKLEYSKRGDYKYYLEEWESLLPGWNDFFIKATKKYTAEQLAREAFSHEELLKKLR